MGKMFTPAEVEAIRTKPLAELKRMMPDRTPGTLLSKRYRLRNHTVQGFTREWSGAELKIMRAFYPISSNKKMLQKLPGRSHDTISSQARRMKLRKKYLGTSFEIDLEGHRELIDQIRIRCKADGITFKYLDKVCGRKRYFAKNNHRRQSVNLHVIVRALDFFGGKLVIDWNDK